MSDSSDDEYNLASSSGPSQAKKKRRLPGACDACRKKKTKCNSAEMPGNVCSSCIAAGVDCSHDMPNRKKGGQKEYIQRLEQRIAYLEDLVRTLRPDHDLTKGSPLTKSAGTSLTKASGSSRSSQSPLVSELSATAADDEETERSNDVTKKMESLRIQPAEDRYFGKSSNFALMSMAIGMKEEYEGSSQNRKKMRRREHYWDMAMWERSYILSFPDHKLYFPDYDLLEELITLYFRYVNTFYPILHQPTFRRLVENQHHLRDFGFGGLVLMVCAVAARYTDDPRVLWDQNVPDYLSSGFGYFQQVPLMDVKRMFNVVSLYELQSQCVALIYILGMTSPMANWAVLSAAIRSAQDRGLHKRLPNSGSKSSKTVEDELWKRVWWFLVSWDTLTTFLLGRPSAILLSEIEIDFPEECDDEYWVVDGLGVSFQQPYGKPSKVSAFNAHLRLADVYAAANRTLYASPKTRSLFGIAGEDWESQVVTELDSTLNQWLDSVPDHLRWDPHREDSIFFDQSCMIHAIYYGLQIQIHRPFIHRDSPLAFPSLAICTNASRSCARVMDAQVKRGSMRMPHAQMACYISGLVLLMNIWGAKRAGISLDPEKELSFVDMILRYLNIIDKRWHLAGRFWDFINNLTLSIRQSPPEPAERTSLKRTQEEAEHEHGTTQEFQAFNTSSPPSLLPSTYELGNMGVQSPAAGSPYSYSQYGTPPTQPPHHPGWSNSQYGYPSSDAMPQGYGYPNPFPDSSMEADVGAYGLADLERISQQYMTEFSGTPNQSAPTGTEAWPGQLGSLTPADWGELFVIDGFLDNSTRSGSATPKGSG